MKGYRKYGDLTIDTGVNDINLGTQEFSLKSTINRAHQENN